MAVLRNDLFLSSDRGIRGSKASLSQELCLTVGQTELGSLRLVAEVNPRAAPVRVLGDCGAPAFLWGREEKMHMWNFSAKSCHSHFIRAVCLPAFLFLCFFLSCGGGFLTLSCQCQAMEALGKGEAVGRMGLLQLLCWSGQVLPQSPGKSTAASSRAKVLLVDLYSCALHSNHSPGCINPLPHWWMTSTITTCVKKNYMWFCDSEQVKSFW